MSKVKKHKLTDSEVYSFGFEVVDAKTKSEKVHNVFLDVASKYDIMNDLMSVGVHRLWKNKLVNMLPKNSGGLLLDLAGGTGDIAHRFLENGGEHVFVCDANEAMLKAGKDRSIDKNSHINLISWVCSNAESLPFPDDTFDYCTISFGIRNFVDIDRALLEVYRVLKPAGRFLCLEFSPVQSANIKGLYDFYSFHIIPKIGKLITGYAEHYQYLAESIRKFPAPNKFAKMIENAGFFAVDFEMLSLGIVAIHHGYKA